ncbi:MAG TPA: 2-phosphosulfolactate phosphatase [Acidimicrobiia bacterium]
MSSDPSGPFDQHGFDARVEWGPHGLRRLARSCEVVVIIDVLSFTTALDVALGRGATVLPYRFADDRQAEYAAAASALLAVGRRATDAAHPFSLSPATLLDLPAGSRLVLPSPNGSALAFGAAEAGARAVLASCLRNAAAVAAVARTAGGSVGVVPAGERWHGTTGPLRPALEDLLGAGALLAALAPSAPSPEARAAVAAFAEAAPHLGRRLMECASGRELVEGGFPDDVRPAAELNVSRVAPQLQGEAFVDGS